MKSFKEYIHEDIYGHEGRTKPIGPSSTTSHSTHSSGHSGSYVKSLDQKLAKQKENERKAEQGKSPEEVKKMRDKRKKDRMARMFGKK